MANSDGSMNNTTTFPTSTDAQWTFVPTALVFVFTASLTLNASVLLLFATHPKFITPFNVYLLNLFASNFLYSLLDSPFETINDVYPAWWLPTEACTIFMYAQFTVSLVQQNTHVLIALNRFWAMFSPVTYRNHHNMRVALLFCFGAWVAAHCVGLPLVFLNAKYYGASLPGNPCSLFLDAAQEIVVWMIVVQCACSLDNLFVVSVLPVTWYYRRQRSKIAALRSSAAPASDFGNGGKGHTASHGSFFALGAKEKQAKEKHQDAFLLLVFLTAGVGIFSLPGQTVYIAAPFVTFPSFLYDTFTFLYNCQAVVDPIIFGLALQDIRKCVAKLFGCRNKVSCAGPFNHKKRVC